MSSESAEIHHSIPSILRQLGEGARVAELDAGTRGILEWLEAYTACFWGVAEAAYGQSLEAKCQWLQLVYPFFEAKRRQLQLATPLLETLWRVYFPLAQWVVEQRENCPKEVFILGVNGAQGSGKSTLCSLLQTILEASFEQRVVTLSIDDFYLPRTERQRLAHRVHPLFVTRGVPGTHDVTLGMEVLASLQAANRKTSTQLPVFDKAFDDRIPREKWPSFQGRPDIILFEGWCVGARPEPEERLASPVNLLEAKEDPHGVWRHYVNQALGKEYPQLFGLLDALLLLKIPEFKIVYAQRTEQEQQLARALREGQGGGADRLGRRTLNVQELQRFIMHFQRLTEYMLAEIPTRADLILEIDKHREFRRVKRKFQL